jgi:two-component system, LuxR family, sensor kinase FixL
MDRPASPHRPAEQPGLALEALLDAAVDAILVIDHRGRIDTFNRAAQQLFGYSAAEMIGGNVSRLMPEPDRSAHDGYLARYLETGAARIIGRGRDVTAQRKDGSVFPAFLAIGEIRGASPRRFVGFVHDNSERQAVVDSLRRSELALRASQEMAGLGSFELPLAAADPYWSAESYRITGFYAGEEPRDMDVFIARCVHADDRERVGREWQRAQAKRETLDLEHRLVRPDGTLRAVRLIAQIDRESPAGPVLRGSLHDVSERRAAEDEIRQSQDKLTHFARLSTMGEMATGLAHEINQPLTAIATYAQAATRLIAAGDTDPAELTEVLGQITAQALRAGEVIRRLRNFVKNRVARTETVDLNRLIEDLRVLADTDARASDVRLVVELGTALPPVAADAVQIQQVLLNLVRNAIDVTLETPGARREITVQTRSAGGEVEVRVVDHGRGIAPEVAPQLFNPFFTTKPAGTGLGLAISRSIIRAHRGRLEYTATPGGGATFCFTLPASAGG